MVLSNQEDGISRQRSEVYRGRRDVSTPTMLVEGR